MPNHSPRPKRITLFARRLIANLDSFVAAVHAFMLPLIILLGVTLLSTTLFFAVTNDIAVLNPQGAVAQEQFNLVVFTALLSLIVIIPVFGLTFWITWKYREQNHKQPGRYRPNYDSNRALEAIWWLIPLALISVLGVVIWKSSHQLDPYKPLVSGQKPLTIQVVALEWKWLFLYPEQGIATVNFVQFPQDRPINFAITADAPMNSLWIPQLGGQVYAMAGMETKLHLQADAPGDYQGSSANLSGEGFAGMKFTARASSQAEFDAWVHRVKKASPPLTSPAYNALARPSSNLEPISYALANRSLYNNVIDKYMLPPATEGVDPANPAHRQHETGEHGTHQ